MCKIAHVKVTKNSNYLLKNTNYLFINYTFNKKCTSFHTNLSFLNFLICASLHMIKKPFKIMETGREQKQSQLSTEPKLGKTKNTR
jgi:hypothetical protein